MIFAPFLVFPPLQVAQLTGAIAGSGILKALIPQNRRFNLGCNNPNKSIGIHPGRGFGAEVVRYFVPWCSLLLKVLTICGAGVLVHFHFRCVRDGDLALCRQNRAALWRWQ